MKNLMIGFLMQDLEAHKLAMVYANNAIHTFADPMFTPVLSSK